MTKIKLYIITFLGVGLTIAGVGYFGMNVALEFMQKKYIELQLDVNKRQAETMAKILEMQLSSGSTEDAVREKFQKAILDSQVDKGFLCMFDKNTAALACHPDEKFVGAKLDSKFSFDDFTTGKSNKTKDELAKGVSMAGIFNTPKNSDIAYITPVKGTNWMLASHENIAQINAEIERQRKLFRIGFIILSLLAALIATLMARLVGRKYEKTIEAQNEKLMDLNEELNQQKEEILTQNEEIETQKSAVEKQRDELGEKNQEITASIQYAKRIQEALLPPKTLIFKSLPNHFIYFSPKDIVSGDFYWFKNVGQFAVFAAADCTGHGVPGAFMSMLGISFLNEIISEGNHEECDTSMILNGLRDRVKTALRQDSPNSTTKDGMDIALIAINNETLELHYSGAYNPLFIIRNGEFTEVDADRMPVGIYRKDQNTFTNKIIQLEKEDMLYLFTDGFQDQFGGERGRKFMAKRFKTLLHKNSNLPLPQQKQVVADTYKAWKGQEEQVDDVLVVGIKI